MSSSGKVVTISLPEESTTIKININSATTVGEMTSILENRPAYAEAASSGDKFGISMEEDPSIVFPNPDTRLAKIPSEGFAFRKILTNVTVEEVGTGRSGVFRIDPLMSAKDFVLFVEHHDLAGCEYSISTRPSAAATPKHELFLLTNTSLAHIPSNGVRMEYERSLASYRLKRDRDILLLGHAQAQSQAWAGVTGAAQIAIIITSAEFDLSKAFKFSSSDTFETVVVKFLEKANVKESKWFFALYLNVAGDVHEMQHDWHLSEFPLPTPARLELRRKKREPREWFGTDPTTLPMLKDPQSGIEVPEILVMLRDMLIAQNAFEQEGIFRKSGLESEMTVLREKIESGEPFHSHNAHSVATLMKRWYKQLPKRLFTDFDRQSITEDQLIYADQQLTDIDRRLFHWLLCMLLLVVEKHSLNKMDPKNCAIVWGPGMVGAHNEAAIGAASAMEGFEDTRFGISIVENNLRYLHENGLRPSSTQESSPATAPPAESPVPTPAVSFSAGPPVGSPPQPTPPGMLPRPMLNVIVPTAPKRPPASLPLPSQPPSRSRSRSGAGPGTIPQPAGFGSALMSEMMAKRSLKTSSPAVTPDRASSTSVLTQSSEQAVPPTPPKPSLNDKSKPPATPPPRPPGTAPRIPPKPPAPLSSGGSSPPKGTPPVPPKPVVEMTTRRGVTQKPGGRPHSVSVSHFYK